jgi:hypothetical protein
VEPEKTQYRSGELNDNNPREIGSQKNSLVEVLVDQQPSHLLVAKTGYDLIDLRNSQVFRLG